MEMRGCSPRYRVGNERFPLQKRHRGKCKQHVESKLKNYTVFNNKLYPVTHFYVKEVHHPPRFYTSIISTGKSSLSRSFSEHHGLKIPISFNKP